MLAIQSLYLGFFQISFWLEHIEALKMIMMIDLHYLSKKISFIFPLFPSPEGKPWKTLSFNIFTCNLFAEILSQIDVKTRNSRKKLSTKISKSFLLFKVNWVWVKNVETFNFYCLLISIKLCFPSFLYLFAFKSQLHHYARKRKKKRIKNFIIRILQFSKLNLSTKKID